MDPVTALQGRRGRRGQGARGPGVREELTGPEGLQPDSEQDEKPLNVIWLYF